MSALAILAQKVHAFQAMQLGLELRHRLAHRGQCYAKAAATYGISPNCLRPKLYLTA